ncbi:MAG: YdcF family protein [Clostridia bacterium]|nr:YdcF family protein [Clostridia bacterium]
MRKAVKQIAVCVLILIVFCVVCRLTVFRTYTVHIPLQSISSGENGEAFQPRLELENPDSAHLGAKEVKDGYLHVPVHPDRSGEIQLRLLNQQGEETAFYLLRAGPSGMIYDLQTGGFTGDSAVLIAITLFWFLVSAIMLWHYHQAKGPAYYAYSTIYYAGFSFFSLVTGMLMLAVTARHLLQPAQYAMLSAYNAINSASMQFMMLTMPAMLVFALAMAISNVELLRHERPRLQNLFGLLVSLLLVAGEIVGVFLFTRDFSGSEMESRIRNTLENVYATGFVYFQCMLLGSAVCGLKAGKHQPDQDADCIVILGCWFRKDGTLPPLLKGRVDRAIRFWKEERDATGKAALLIPSGGQGKDEPMPEAEAMRRYLIAQGIPDALIYPETESANTYQNMAFSRKITDSLRPEGKTVFSTTNYHVFRSGLWANQAGLAAEGIGQKTVWWFWPNAFMRECVGLLQKRWKLEILLLILLMAFFGLLSMILG